MAILKFRAYFAEDESVYRDIVLKHTQTFFNLHEVILKAYEFDCKHDATFYRSNDGWQQGREISLQKYDKKYINEPLIMAETTMGSEVRDPNQKFIYEYDFTKKWLFLIELININKEEDPKISYPSVTRVDGLGPQQYGTKSLLGDKFADIEERYDLASVINSGFGVEGEADTDDNSEELGEEEGTNTEEE